MTTVTPYKPPAAALIERIHAHADRLAAATDPHAALAALFLLHCECRTVADALEPAVAPVAPAAPVTQETVNID